MPWWSREEIAKQLGDTYDPETYAAALGEEIRRRRETRGLSQDEFAAAIGASRRAVIYWEMGERIPQGKYLHEIDRLTAAAPHERLLKDAGFIETLDHLKDLYERAVTGGPSVRPDIAVDPTPMSPQHSVDHHVTRGPRRATPEPGKTPDTRATVGDDTDTPCSH